MLLQGGALASSWSTAKSFEVKFSLFNTIDFRRKGTFVALFLGLLVLILVGSTVSSQPESLVINEFLASNQESLADGDEDHEDWIELYNPTTEPIDLEGYTLTDSPKTRQNGGFRTLLLILRASCSSGLRERIGELPEIGILKDLSG